MSYEIIECSCPSSVSFKPSTKQIKDIEKKLGLGALAEKFKEVTSHKSLCEKVKKAARNRNLLAHKAAAEWLSFLPSADGANKCQEKADEFRKAADAANKLYYELMDVYNQIEAEHGQLV
jgi:hypothetical protein